MNLLSLSQLGQGGINSNTGAINTDTTTHTLCKNIPIFSGINYYLSIILKNIAYFSKAPTLDCINCYSDENATNRLITMSTTSLIIGAGITAYWYVNNKVFIYQFSVPENTKFITVSLSNGEDENLNSITHENLLSNAAIRLSYISQDAESTNTIYAPSNINNINKQGQLQTSTFTEGFSTAQIGKSSIILGNQLYEF